MVSDRNRENPCGWQSVEEEAEFRSFSAAWERADYEEAAHWARVFVARFPERDLGLALLGDALLALGKTDEAADNYGYIIHARIFQKRDRSRSGGRSGAGDRSRRDTLDAIAADLAQEAEDFHAARMACWGLARIAEASGASGAALEWYRHALDSFNIPAYEEPYLRMVRFFLRMGRPWPAVKTAKDAVDRFPASAEAWTMLGAAYLQVEHVDDAARCARTALGIDPENEHSLDVLTAALSETAAVFGREEIGQGAFGFDRDIVLDELFHQAMTLVSKAPRLWGTAGVAGVRLCEAGRYGPARDLFSRLLRIMPEEPELWNNLAYTYLQMTDLESAESACRRSLMLRPNHPDSLDTMAGILEAKGRTHEAVTLLEHALAVDSTHDYSRDRLVAITQRPTSPGAMPCPPSRKTKRSRNG